MTRITLRSVIWLTCFQFLSTMTLLMPLSRITLQIRQISRAIKNWKQVTQATDRNVILVKGEVVFEGTSAALAAQPELLQQFLGV